MMNFGRLIPLFATELPPNTLFRLWDILFTEGSHVLVCASAAVIEVCLQRHFSSHCSVTALGSVSAMYGFLY